MGTPRRLNYELVIMDFDPAVHSKDEYYSYNYQEKFGISTYYTTGYTQGRIGFFIMSPDGTMYFYGDELNGVSGISEQIDTPVPLPMKNGNLDATNRAPEPQ